MAGADAFKFTVNAPSKVHIKFIDVRPGSVRAGKKLPNYVSLKGTFDGVDTIAFLPGPAWKNVKSLADAGIIDEAGKEVALTAANNEELASAASVPVKIADATACLTKLAGDKYEEMRYTTGAAAPSKRITHAEATGISRGAIPEMDDFPAEDYGRSIASPDGADPYLDSPKAPTPHRVPTAPSVPPVAPVAQEKMNRARQYLDLFAWVQAETKVAPEVAQPIAATIWIDWKQAGLVK